MFRRTLLRFLPLGLLFPHKPSLASPADKPMKMLVTVIFTKEFTPSAWGMKGEITGDLFAERLQSAYGDKIKNNLALSFDYPQQRIHFTSVTTD